MDIKKQPVGKTESGLPVDLFTLSNDNGVGVKISNYGGIVVSAMTPDRNGEFGDIVLGFDTLEEYIQQNPYFGCIVGRCANRIAQGKFRLNGVEYKLAQNNGQNHLHGGIRGFDKVVWTAEAVTGEGEVGLKLTYLSRDGEEGYPGNLSVEVIYTLTQQNELKIDYAATTDQVTIMNLSNHSYFNLAEAGDVLGHELMINADRFTPIDETLIPTGELRVVKGTPMDFTRSTPIGARIDQPDEQLQLAGGYDHNWVLNNPNGSLSLAARVKEPTSGRVLEVYTTQPGVQFYTGNFLDELVGKGGQVYRKRSGFCLETQHFPDSPNQPDFPSVVLKPGERYAQTTVFRFAVDR
jgi:aldose 1-epimerase